MTKTEFLEELRRHLAGQMQEGKVLANVRYYDEYIQEQVNAGKDEQQVLQELGDPRLIARTLRDTDTDSSQEIYEKQDINDEEYGSADGKYSRANGRAGYFQIDFSKWYVKLIAAAVVILIVVAMFALLSAVLPFFLILAVILFVLSWFKKR